MKQCLLLFAISLALASNGSDTTRPKRYIAVQISPAVGFNSTNLEGTLYGMGGYIFLKSYRTVSVLPFFGLTTNRSTAWYPPAGRTIYTAELGATLNIRAGKFINLRGSAAAGVEVHRYKDFSSDKFEHATAPMIGLYAGAGTSIGRIDASIDYGLTTYTPFSAYLVRLNVAYVFNNSHRKIHPIEAKDWITLRVPRKPVVFAELFSFTDGSMNGSGQGFKAFFANYQARYTVTPGFGLQYVVFPGVQVYNYSNLKYDSYNVSALAIDALCSFERNFSASFSWKMGVSAGLFTERLRKTEFPLFCTFYTGPLFRIGKTQYSADFGIAHMSRFGLFGKLGFGYVFGK